MHIQIYPNQIQMSQPQCRAVMACNTGYDSNSFMDMSCDNNTHNQLGSNTNKMCQVQEVREEIPMTPEPQVITDIYM